MKNIIKKQQIENRKAFNFLRSYYDVLDEIHDDTDKLKYLMAILDKQFKGIEPELNGISKLCYVGQKHSIEASRKGWEDKVGYEPPTHTIGGSQGGCVGGMGHPTEGPTEPPSGDSVMTTEPPTEGGIEPPYLQEKEKEKEKEKEYITSSILGEFEKKQFYRNNKNEIEFLRTNYGYDVDTAIEVHYNNVKTLDSIGWVIN